MLRCLTDLRNVAVEEGVNLINLEKAGNKQKDYHPHYYQFYVKVKDSSGSLLGALEKILSAEEKLEQRIKGKKEEEDLGFTRRNSRASWRKVDYNTVKKIRGYGEKSEDDYLLILRFVKGLGWKGVVDGLNKVFNNDRTIDKVTTHYHTRLRGKRSTKKLLREYGAKETLNHQGEKLKNKVIFINNPCLN
jgi:hypothetical protein